MSYLLVLVFYHTFKALLKRSDRIAEIIDTVNTIQEYSTASRKFKFNIATRPDQMKFQQFLSQSLNVQET